MSKNKFEHGQLSILLDDLVFILVLAVFSVFYLLDVNQLKNEKNVLLDTIAHYKCREMQYEGEECNEWDLKPTQACSVYYGTHYPYNCDRVYNLTSQGGSVDYLCCNFERICEDKIYKNFTTGRYIDGKIECYGGEKIDELTCLRVCFENKKCFEDCMYNSYDICQKFTLEELGLK